MRKGKIVQVLVGLLLVAALVLVPMACKAPEEVAPPAAPPGEVVPPAAPPEEVAPVAPAWEGPYKIGASLNLTGAMAEFGASCKGGSEVAVEQINAQGGILGRPVELVSRDDKTDPDEAIRVLKEFYLDAKCDAFFLSPPGIAQIPQLRYSKEHSLLAFASQGQDMSYLNDLIYPYYFIMGPTAMQQANGFVKYVAGRKEIKSFVTFAPDYTWGHENVEAFTEGVQELRPEIECRGNFWPPLEELEFGSYITAMMGTEADLVITWVFGTTYVSFVKQAASYGLVDAMQVLSWVYQADLYEGGKDIPSGLTIQSNNEYWTNRKNQSPYYEAFERAYVAKRGRLPGLGACQYYDQVMTLMQGIKKAGSFDKDEIAKAIEGSTFMTLRGPQFMRPINHAYADRQVYFGTTKYDEELGYCIAVDVVEIPGAELMVSDEEYLRYREEKGIVFKPWHEDWYKDLPWAE